MAAQLVVDIITNATNAVLGFKKVDQAAANTATNTAKSGTKLASFAKAVATGYAVTKVIDFGKESVNAAESAAVANQRLAGLFAATGDATGDAAKQAEDYAESLGRQIGVSPQVIEGAQGILTAFHAVSNETDRQQGIFNGATKAAADLAAAGFGDLTSNAKTLGKALSDPITGMTQLRKAGVVLTTAQKDQITAMEKSGNLLGAQKLLLGDVNQAVGGAAAATATASSKMGVAWDEAKVSIGTKLLPVVQSIQGVLVNLITFVSAHSDWIGPMALAIGVVAGAVTAVRVATTLWTTAMTIAKTVAALWSAVTRAAAYAQLFFNMAMDANPIGLIIIAVALLIAGLVLLITHVSVVRAVMIEVWNAVASVATAAFRGILNIINLVWQWIAKNWPLLLAILTGPIGIAVLLIARYWDTIISGARSAWNAVVGAARSAVSWIQGIPGYIAGAFASLFRIITQPFADAWNWIRANIIGPMSSAFSGVFSTIGGAFQHVKDLWNGFARTFNGISISVHMPSNVVTKFLHIDGLGFTWTPPFRLPQLATGGVFDRATLAVVGEGASREIVSPEPLLRSIVGGASSDTTITINVNVPPTANPAATGRAVVDALRAYVRANGPIPGIAVA